MAIRQETAITKAKLVSMNEDEYLNVEQEELVHAPEDVLEHDVIDEEEVDGWTSLSPSKALHHCLELQEYLMLNGDQKMFNSLVNITQELRVRCNNNKKQLTIDDYYHRK